MTMTTAKRFFILTIAAAISATIVSQACAASGDDGEVSHRIGGGIHYWRTVKEIKDDSSFDRYGVSYLCSYQMAVGWIKLEADLEIYPKNFRGSDEVSLQPMAFAMVGGVIYAGLGVGAVYTDDDNLNSKWSDPIMILRAGLDLPLLPILHLDVNANYQFTKWADWDRFDTDTITIGAQARLVF